MTPSAASKTRIKAISDGAPVALSHAGRRARPRGDFSVVVRPLSRIPLRGTRLRRAVDPGDLCPPSGPDGEELRCHQDSTFGSERRERGHGNADCGKQCGHHAPGISPPALGLYMTV
jgi:hypothetical protein